ncbi:hypothetical protein GCM10023338_22520 [Wohlfahrtiimonas larvae]|uniref:Uncharacterized protein n=2 Tax=Wohlfahrtiimonas larvae TaxID=1157986 RepID=A0ABP9N0C2_9GAMM
MGNFLVHQAEGVARFDDVVSMPVKEAIGQRVYVGGEIVIIDVNQKQMELIKRTINSSGYPVQGTNILNERIVVTFTPEVRFDFDGTVIGDRVVVLGNVESLSKENIAGNDMIILKVKANDYRAWTSQFPNKYDNNRWEFSSGRYLYPRRTTDSAE